MKLLIILSVIVVFAVTKDVRVLQEGEQGCQVYNGTDIPRDQIRCVLEVSLAKMTSVRDEKGCIQSGYSCTCFLETHIKIVFRAAAAEYLLEPATLVKRESATSCRG